MAMISVNLPDQLVQQIDRMAGEKYLNRSSLIRMILAEHVETAKSPSPPAVELSQKP